MMNLNHFCMEWVGIYKIMKSILFLISFLITSSVFAEARVYFINLEDGDFDFAVQSENDKLTVKLKNNSHLPSNFINASWQGFYVTASQRI